ncbi:MAG: exopolysaccharide Pel transporter PelG [Sulfitobacter sp.]|nr:exopolysaccharide Pel transporter PelG [Sulfitobacter sp.]
MTGPLPEGLRAKIRHLDWYLDGPLLHPLRKSAGALIVAAGPWILAIATLLLIGRTAQHWMGAEAIEDMRLAVVYAFMLAPLVATPLGITAARAISDGKGGPDGKLDIKDVGALMLVACAVAGIAAQALAMGVALALRLSDPALVLAFAVLTASSAMMWTAFIVLRACHARHRLILAFAAGMAGAVVLSLLTAKTAQSSANLVWCFSAGIALSVGFCLAPLGLAGLEGAALWRAAGRMHETARTTWPLALGAMFAIAGVWADKWVAWAGPQGLTSTAGFVHSPTYDSALFLAHLSAVPGLAALALHFEAPLPRAMARFRAALSRGACLRMAEREAGALGGVIWTGIQRSMMAQLALSTGFLLMAPILATAACLRLDQFLILRTGIAGILLHALFLAASAVLILFNRKLAFLAVQFLFLAVNLVASSALSLTTGTSALGFAMAALISGTAATLIASATIRDSLRHSFLDGNDALYRTG